MNNLNRHFFYDGTMHLWGLIQCVTLQQWVVVATVAVVLLYGFVKNF